MILNSKKVIRTFKFCIAVLLCISSYSFAHADEQNAQQVGVFSIHGTDVPDSVMNVMKYCANIWNEYITTPITINVNVSWQELKSNVNAYAKPTNYYTINGIFYPVALAEKLQKKNLNANEPDIEVVINKTMKWYLDPDKIPSELSKGQYDLTTTLLHEIAHGLGYIGSITSENLTTTEFSAPTVFDMLVADKDGKPIVTKKDDSYILDNTVLTGNDIYWNGKFAKAYCGEKLKLYAPENFNSGSTVYHLDETAYPTDCGFELMTPKLSQNEIFRKPDMATIAMIADLGWNEHFIAHTTPRNNANLNSNTNVSFAVIDTLLQKDKQTILYSFDAGKHIIELPANYNEENKSFDAEIPSLTFDHTISYAIRSITVNNDTTFIPVTYPNEYFSVFIGDDVEAPVITHTPITSIKTNATGVSFTAEISDNFDIDSAYVIYYVDPNNKLYLNFLAETPTVELEFSPDMKFSEGDKLYYTIGAVDYAGNTTILNNGDFFSATFEEPQDPIHYFITDFEDDNVENYFTLDKFSISKENGFENNALHSTHPYAYSGMDGKYNQYTATLKQPIVIASHPATMTFDEVVLVEPGKAGISYGTFGFWDYVIVEGSKDAENWYALGKVGWDSHLSDIWKNRYYSETKTEGDNTNSLAVGDSTLFKKHTINLLENKYFRTGDTIFVRFRLLSDATNYAWGWAIDNLKIQERISLPISVIQNNTILYPNPCENTLYINRDDVASVKIYSLTGNLVLFSDKSPISVSHIPEGMYIATITFKNGESKTEKIIIK